MSNIDVYKNNIKLEYKRFVFPAGEVGIKLDLTPKYLWEDCKLNKTKIVARIQNSEDLVALAMIKDALMQAEEENFELFMPYVPYSRQDRVCVKGESFSLKVFCDFINSLKFNKVVVFDTHSHVTDSLLNNVKVITQFDIINKFSSFSEKAKNCVLISPDSGANKKTAEIAKYFEHDSFVRCDKLRNLNTGEIKETIVYYDDFKGKNVCIIDDLCEKGGTFIALANILKKKNAGKIILFVSHGLFSGDINSLYDSGISEIYTTNSYRIDLIESEKFHIFNLEEKFIKL